MSQPQPPWNPEGQQGQQSYPGEQYGPPSPQGPYQQQPGWPPQGQPPYIPPGSQPRPYPGPGYGPPQQPAGPGSSNGHWVRNILAGIGAVVVVSFVVSHLANSGGSSATSSAAASSSSCQSQLDAWQQGAGPAQLSAVTADFYSMYHAAVALQKAADGDSSLSSAETGFQTAAVALQSDAQTAQDNLPPSCVPGARQDDTTGLADASKPAIDYQNVISELSAGSYSVATGDTSAADAVIGTAISKVRAGGNAVSAFGTG